MQWIYLLIAAVFEAAWAFSLKYLDFQKIKTIQWDTIFSMKFHLYWDISFLE